MPAGGQVVGGAAAIAQQGNVMNIAQQTQQAIINWQAFNIAAGERVNFLQPNANAAILNRILGNNPSQIFGAISANGRVFLVNPAGVLFAPGAQVSVGSLVASSLNISNADFMQNRLRWTREVRSKLAISLWISVTVWTLAKEQSAAKQAVRSRLSRRQIKIFIWQIVQIQSLVAIRLPMKP